MRNLRQRQFRDKTAYVGGQDFRPKLRFSCSVATALQRFVPPWLSNISIISEKCWTADDIYVMSVQEILTISTHFSKVQEILPISVQTLIPLLNYYHSHNQGRIWCLIGRGGELSRQSHPLYFLPLFFEIQTILFLDCFKKNILSFNAHVTDFTKWICHSNFLLVHCFTKSVSTLSFLK